MSLKIPQYFMSNLSSVVVTLFYYSFLKMGGNDESHIAITFYFKSLNEEYICSVRMLLAN